MITQYIQLDKWNKQNISHLFFTAPYIAGTFSRAGGGGWKRTDYVFSSQSVKWVLCGAAVIIHFYKRHWLSLSSSFCQTCCQDERIFSNMSSVEGLLYPSLTFNANVALAGFVISMFASMCTLHSRVESLHSRVELATKSGLRFWIWASQVPFFCTQNHWKWPFSGAKKWDLGCPNPKTETTFCRQLSPKMVE